MMTSSRLIDKQDELENILSDSGSELESEEDWVGDFIHFLFNIGSIIIV